ncbi:EamA family transporter [Mucilaginibacter dorajii]|uniref:DMT family transporter n=1 Tax=Mucilaginibacter dorajii TaxID=692994 RepID=A0ABP7PED1_9SPHI|nr:DMT family transporter [Mucilaginibacter dorajii]MCS3734606.1 inner membrane transporter RhtA [Mucilaginibacter dorajii]
MQKNKIPIRPLLAVLGSILSVQIGAAIAKELFPALGAAVTATLRIGLSAIILLAVNRPGLKTLTREQWKAVIPYGLCLGAMNLIYYLALSRIPLGIAVTLEFMGPLLLVVFSSKRLIEFLWVLLAAGGIALMTPWNNTNIDLFGAGMALLAGAFWAGYIVLGRQVSAVLDGRQAVTIGMLFALLVALPFAFTSGTMVNFKSGMIIPALSLALFCSAVPFSLEMYGLKYIPTKTFSILMSMEPAVGAICGLIFLKEYLSLQEYAAVILVVIASTGATLGNREDMGKITPEI